MMTLFFDCETTGIPLRDVDIEDPRQPRIVQLAAELCDEHGGVIHSLNAIVKPDGWTSIPEGAQKAHGIPFERCVAEGRNMKEVLTEFNDMKSQAIARAAYNISFDKRLLLREAKWHKIEHESSKFNNSSYCVMKMATPICNLPPTARVKETGFDYKPKAPKLVEAYKYFFGKDFERAHDAMNDVRACKEIFFHIRDTYGEHFKPEPPPREYRSEMPIEPDPREQVERPEPSRIIVSKKVASSGDCF